MWLLAATLALTVPVAPAAPTEPLRHVIVVGLNHSPNPALKPLRYADDDAVQYAQLFSHFADRVTLLAVLDDDTQRASPDAAKLARPPTKKALADALKQSYAVLEEASRAGRPTELLFVYVGHGQVNALGQASVTLLDAALTRNDVFEQIVAASPADHTHLLVDACHAFALVAGRGEGKDDDGDAAFASFLNGHDLDRYPNVGFLTAATDSQQTHEWSRIKSGVFSHLVRSALSGAGDVNHDGVLEYSEVAAFVDNASVDLGGKGQRLRTFAWPPQRDRRQPIVDLHKAKDVRFAVLGDAVSGRLFVERESGERWAEFNKPRGKKWTLALPREQVFLRNDQNELVLAASEQTLRVDEMPNAAYAIDSRGSADVALQAALFSRPFDDGYYRAFVQAKPELHAVTEGKPFLLDESTVRPRAFSAELSAAYTIGGSGLVIGAVEHGGRLGLRVPIIEGFGLAGTVDVGSTAVGAVSVVRGSVLAGAFYRFTLHRRVGLGFQLDLGWGAMSILGTPPSTDPTVGIGRAGLWLDVLLAGGLVAVLGFNGEGQVVTVDGREAVRGGVGGSFGLAWRWF
ncbi:MAG: caspase family protein [Deltaproteobacteria bacterium]|nr:caspase family protein [Deltaproteobacteria bacterium]